MIGWLDECYAGPEQLRAAANAMGMYGTSMKKYRSYHDNDLKHKAKALAKRRKRNKNLKTHRI